MRISSLLCHAGGLKLGMVEVFVLLPDCMRKLLGSGF